MGVPFTEADAINNEARTADNLDALVVVVVKADSVAVTVAVSTGFYR